MLLDAWIIWFEDAERERLHFSGDGAEQAAHRTFKCALTNWNCHLLRTIELNPELAGD